MATWNKNKNKYFRGGDLFEVVMIADANGSVGGSQGPQISLPSGQESINKFGYTGTDVNGSSTVWDGNGTTASYPYPANGVVSITSSAGGDTGKAIEVQGLDDAFNQVTETVPVGGTGSVTFSRVFRASVVGTTHAGAVSINIGGSLAAVIQAENGQTLMALYTIPAGKTGFLLQFQGSADKAAAVKFKLFAGNNLKGQWGTQGGNPVTYNYPIPIKFPAMTDIRVDVETTSNCGCGAIFDILLVDND